jgi:hypothetical protein
MDILWLLAEGMSTKDIARNLGKKPETIRTERQNMLVRLGVHSSAHAVALAYERGWWTEHVPTPQTGEEHVQPDRDVYVMAPWAVIDLERREMYCQKCDTGSKWPALPMPMLDFAMMLRDFADEHRHEEDAPLRLVPSGDA